MTVYSLPTLDYGYAALEPFISAEIMELHFSKHHQAYVTGANTALDKLAEARTSADYGTISKLEKDLAFNLGGHINHSIFWRNMSPDGGGQPTGPLATELDSTFGGWEAFQRSFSEVALSLQGSGWAVLAWDCLGGRLGLYQLYDQQNNLPAAQIPLLQLDMWEHAFYLQYRNVKADYVKAWWNVVNWDDVSQRLDRAHSLPTDLI
ncbi:MAG: superoxide dismutase [Propionibacteriaceae bacterium]|jgi:Fe-Mn family superoxide dismutase|nr:superoxide dismutase [Propionibacteriaceae bacterium]